jgi:anti-anti-sigma factor
MTNENNSAPVSFETSGQITIARFTAKEISSLEQIDLILCAFKTQIDSLDPPWLLIDFSHVSFVATSAINMLLVVLKRVRMKGGDVCLCGVMDNVQQIFNLMQLNKLFELWPSCEKALAALTQKSK